MIRFFVRLCAALAVAGSLAACQSTSIALNPSLEGQLAAAGFVRNPALTAAAPATLQAAAYSCPASRCGADVMVMLTIQQNPDAGLQGITAEQAIKANILNPTGLRALMQQRLPDVQITSLTLNARAAQMRMTGTKMINNTAVHASVIADVRGNESRMIFAGSKSAAVAAKYARSSWVP